MTRTDSGTPEGVLHDFGNRLRRLRRAQRLRQLDMQDRGLSYKYYQRLEAGQVNPTLLTLHKLAAALNVPVYVLLCPKQDHQASTRGIGDG
jgi:transcriptional regulator with XRE-family HTH domain